VGRIALSDDDALSVCLSVVSRAHVKLVYENCTKSINVKIQDNVATTTVDYRMRLLQILNFDNSKWRTTAILKIIISAYCGEMQSDFDDILCATTADSDYNETSAQPKIFKFSKSNIGKYNFWL